MNNFPSTIVLASLLVSAQLSNAVITTVIDDFHDLLGAPEGPIMIVSTADPSDTQTDTLTAPSLASTVRTTKLDLGGLALSTVSTTLAAGNLFLGADTGTSGVLTLDYDFSPVAGGSVDLAGALNNVIELEFVSSDNPPNPSPLTLTIQSVGGGNATASINTNFPAQSFPITESVAFSSFPGVNFSQVTKLTLSWTAQNSYDGGLNIIGAGFNGAIPEPSAVLLLVGSLGLWSSVRRRK